MENVTIDIRTESPKERDDLFEAITIIIMENLQKNLEMKRKICLLAGYPEITAEEEGGERRYISRAAETMVLYFLREIDDDELSEKLANILHEEVPRSNATVHKNRDGSVSIYSRKELPEIRWQIFPEDIARLINAGIALSRKKEITLKNFFRSEDHYKEMITSLYGNPEDFALGITVRISEFFPLKLSESIFMDILIDSEDPDKVQNFFKVNKIDRFNGKNTAIAGAIVAIESAMEIFGNSEMQEKKLVVLKKQLEELKKQ